jgi:hypothetical protein
MTSRNGLKWKKRGEVVAPDWSPVKECGQGLHGLLWGEGDGSLLNYEPDARWLVVAVNDNAIVDLGGKVKFPKGEVIHCGDMKSATEYIARHGGGGRAIVGYTATAGDNGTATAGDYGTATAGYNGTATAGYNGTATAGDYGTATAGDYGTATAGYNGTATAGDNGTATAAGCYGTATAGDYGTATAGYNGTATAGDYGTAMAGYYGTATAGDYGTLIIKAYDSGRYRSYLANVDENGIEPNKKYRLQNGVFVPA